MTAVAILPENEEGVGTMYRALSGARQSVGKTAGEALDALTAQLSTEESDTLIVVRRSFHPDRFFTDTQRTRLQELMAGWKRASSEGKSLSAEEEAELQALVEAEVQAAGQRAAALRATQSTP